MAGLAAAPGCGGDGGDGSGGAGGSSSSSSSNSSSNSSSASTGGGGPCVPWGTWSVKYMGTGEGCVPMAGTVKVSPGPNDGTVQVVFLGDNTMPVDDCSDPPTPGSYSATGTVSADGCTLTLESSLSYCTSMEEQCEERKLTLEINGDSATGSLDYKKCWCFDFDPIPVTAPATATRTM